MTPCIDALVNPGREPNATQLVHVSVGRTKLGNSRFRVGFCGRFDSSASQGSRLVLPRTQAAIQPDSDGSNPNPHGVEWVWAGRGSMSLSTHYKAPCGPKRTDIGMCHRFQTRSTNGRARAGVAAEMVPTIRYRRNRLGSKPSGSN